MFIVARAVLIGLLLGQEVSIASEPQGPDWASASLDDLILALPDVGDSSVEVGDEWELRPPAAELRRRLDGGATLSDAQWAQALLGSGAIRYRARWPVDRPVAVSMRKPPWLGYAEIRLRPLRAGLKPASVGETIPTTRGVFATNMYRYALHQELGRLPIGSHHLEFEVAVERGSSFWSLEDEGGPPRGVIWTGPLAFDVNVVASLDEAVPPVSDPAVDAAVRNCLSVAFDQWPEGSVSMLVADPDVSDGSALARLALSLRFEVRKGKTVVERGRLIPSTYDPIADVNSVHDGGNQPFGFCTLKSIAAKDEARFAGEQWTLRVTGTSKDVWRLWDADERWSGELVIPVTELIQRERERAPDGRAWIWSPTPR